MSTLREKLLSRQRESRGSREWKTFYVPSEVREVLSLDEIRQCISRFPTAGGNLRDERRFSTLIKETSLFIFAILLLNGHESHIFDFLYRREGDIKLTYSLDGLYFLPPIVAKEFVSRQWELCPVVFKTGEIHRQLRPREVLPFLEDQEIDKGGFGTVFKVRLACNSQDLDSLYGLQPSEHEKETTQLTDAQDVFIARKELREKRNGDRERGILDLLGTLQHPNIIRFLGSYTQYDVENLLFPYVPMNLAQLLESKNQMDTHDIYIGVHGIADALSKIHEFSFSDGGVEFSRIGCHHDFRPSNILVLDKTFLIADFGLSSLKPDDRDSKSKLKGGHDNYLGPEAFDQPNWENGAVGRALDVWSFGCVLTEIATFIEGQSVKEFEAKREATYGSDIVVTDCAFHLGGKIRPAVLDWLASLTSCPKDPQVSSLIDLAIKMLNPNSYRRIKLAAATEELASIQTSSQTQAITDTFQSMLSAAGSGLDETTVQIILERKRFESWARIYGRLHKDDRMHSFIGVSRDLSRLRHALVSAETDLQDLNQTGRQTHVTTHQVQTTLDSLCMHLPSTERGKVQDEWTRSVCALQDTELLLAIRSVGNLNRYRHVGVGAAMRYMSQIITTSILHGNRSRYIDSGCIDVDQERSINPNDFPDIALIEDRTRTMGHMYEGSGCYRIVVEWKEYDYRWQDDQGSELFTIMDALANLLDPDVTHLEGTAKERILACRGYFHEPANYRFGFVYSMNPSTAEDVQLFSLNNIIRISQPDASRSENVARPHLGDIFKLAKDIAQCLYTFHNAGWVHKNVTSHHLLVFSPSPQLVHMHVASAVLAGFNDSRPEASGRTLGPKEDFVHYQHPLYQNKTEFRRSFDYFGFGVVLLELGLWTPISVLRGDHPDISSPEEFRKKLLESHVPQLGETMGVVYRDAVAFCLDAENVLQCQGESGSVPPDVRGLFADRVVEPLSHCFA